MENTQRPGNHGSELVTTPAMRLPRGLLMRMVAKDLASRVIPALAVGGLVVGVAVVVARARRR